MILGVCKELILIFHSILLFIILGEEYPEHVVWSVDIALMKDAIK